MDFWNKLFCKHDFHYVTKVGKFDTWGTIPHAYVFVYMCKKCGKVKRIVVNYH